MVVFFVYYDIKILNTLRYGDCMDEVKVAKKKPRRFNFTKSNISGKTKQDISNTVTKGKLTFKQAVIVQKRLETTPTGKPKSYRQISKELKEEHGLEVGDVAIRNTLRKDNVQEIINKEYIRLADVIPRAVDNIINATYKFKIGGNLSKEDKSITWEATKLVAQSHGLLPTTNQSIVHQTLINQTNNAMPPMIAELLKKHFGGVYENETTIEGELLNEEAKP